MEEKEFKKLMECSKLEIQFPDFEEKVMESVRKEEALKKSFWRNIRWSWFLFLCGLVLGLTVTGILSEFEFDFLGQHSRFVIYGVELLIVIMLSLQFDNLVRITFGKKR
jgi:cytochrome c biogenesis protein CcdA